MEKENPVIVLALSEKNDKGKEMLTDYFLNHIGEICSEDEISMMIERLYDGEVVSDGKDKYILTFTSLDINSWIE